MFKTVRYVASRSARLPVAVIGVMALTACQAAHTPQSPPPTPSPEQAAYRHFLTQFQTMVGEQMLGANKERAVGARKLVITFDRSNAILSCHAASAKAPLVSAMPTAKERRDAERLGTLIDRECWKVIYPLVPEHFFNEQGTVELVAPMIFPPTHAERQEARVLRRAQSDFFWQQLMIDRPVDSVGRATFRVQADALGNVQNCLVSLEPVHVRRDAFKLDNPWQTLLTQQCKRLKLQHMPGFTQNEDWRTYATVVVEYAPWKVGRQ